ncbi:VOC family protein [Dactylosporangium sp. CS-047395]|uniref:VOC family protein n=1 Tax=Dactylosporangium sp. CS-047395 TaxID=3239936 RepID=UPI003D931891
MIPAADLARVREWYRSRLGLVPVQELPDSLLYRSGDTLFVVFTAADAGAARHCIACFVVDDLEVVVAELRGRGVAFEQFAPTPVGRAAWFKDSEGNLLELIELDDPR